VNPIPLILFAHGARDPRWALGFRLMGWLWMACYRKT
jgi:hypothetical protein